MPNPNESCDRTLTLAVVGDVHDRWEDADAEALKHLGVDLVLFVGDFGNESVPIVAKISQLNLPKAAIFGNHDAWYTATEWGRKQCPYDRDQEDWVQQQLELLGNADVGYRALDFPELGLAVVGSRPFSWGGSKWKHSEFYQQRYGVSSFEESIERIVGAADATTCPLLIFIGHSGPRGLGDLPEDPCGKDWEPRGGDWGDPDLAAAIEEIRKSGKTIPLVAFGHMHHQLRHTKQRLRRCIHLGPEGTVYLNAANVPRIVSTPTGTVRNFSLATLQGGSICQINRVWVDSTYRVIDRILLYDRNLPIPNTFLNNRDSVG